MATLPWQISYDTPKNAATAGASPSPSQPWEQLYGGLASRQDKPVESQRMRMMAQGASMGWSDEIEAALRSMFPGNEYDQVLQQIRGEINAYKEAQPEVALLQEIGGAGMTGLGGLKMLAQKSPTLGKLLASVPGLGAVVGGTTAAGMSEGSALDRLAAVPAGAALGAAVGTAGFVAGKGLQLGADKFLDFARRRLGGRGAGIVEKQLQDIATQTGLNTDEIVAKIASGEILAENATIRDIVRAYARGGGDAQRILYDALNRRPGELRAGAIEELNKYLAPGMTGNVRKAVTATDEELSKLESSMYESAYGKGAIFTKPLLDAMTSAVKRTRGRAAADLEEAYTAQTGNTPFFKINEKGEVLFDRAPTLEDAEILRRSLQDMQNAAYVGGRPQVGKGYKQAELSLRGEIDTASPAILEARTQAAQRRTAKDRFNDGKSIFSQNADQVDIDFGKLMQSGDANAVRYYRMGAMDAIRARMSGGNRTTMLRKLSDPETKEGQILRHIFPGDELERVLGQLGRATQSAQAAGAVLAGSGTAPTQMAAQNIGAGLSAGEIASVMQGNLFALPGVVSKVINNIAPKGLSPAQRAKVAEILVSENPQVVLNALKDQSGLAQLQMAIQRITQRLPGAGLALGSVTGGHAGASITGAQ